MIPLIRLARVTLRVTPLALALSLLWLAIPEAQQPSAAAVQAGAGQAVFEKSCATCHGDGGVGGRAGALTNNRRLAARSESEIQNIIRNGTPGGMPPFGFMPEADLLAVTRFVSTLNPASDSSSTVAAGNTRAGEQFFFGEGKCAGCHLLGGRGNGIGPDLSNISRQLTSGELLQALREPSARIANGYALVTVVRADGQTLRGFPRNEGNYAMPMQTLDGRLVAVDKRSAKIVRETGSPMPPVSATPDQLRDLMAFLSQQRGPAGALPIGAASSTPSDFDEILKPRPGDWPTYHGRLDGNRHSAHTQITAANVNRLSVQWTHSLRGFDNEGTPLVLDGIMYVTATNQVSALDAATGREIWRYSRPRSTGLGGDAARGFNRGAAVLGNRVFIQTDNMHLLAISRQNGALLWEVDMVPPEGGTYGGTMAPLVIGTNVLVGVSGGDAGLRGFLVAYDAATGNEAWRFWTIPLRGEPGSETWKGDSDPWRAGGATWLTGTYDAESGVLYWPTGNPWPDTDGSERQGDNLYSNCILALDAKTGNLLWYFQTTPHDLWDWDAQEPPVLVDASFQGRPRKLLLQANRNGFFYVLDRTTGEFLRATPFVKKLTWASGIDAKGRPVLIPGHTPDEKGVETCPAIRGATNWMATSYSPATKFFYVASVENCGIYLSTSFGGGRGRGRGAGPAPAAPPAGGGRGAARGGAAGASPFGLAGGGFNAGGPGGGGSMALRAIEVETGRIVWEVAQVGNSNNYGGTLSTAGGLVFNGQASGEFAAFDARTGSRLWHFETQEIWKASPITYMLNGRQYVATISGANVLAFALPTQ